MSSDSESSSSDKSNKVKTLTELVFSKDKLSINDYRPNYKNIYRSLGLPNNYNEYIDPNAE